MEKFYVKKHYSDNVLIVTELYLADGTIFFKKIYTNNECLVIEEYSKYSIKENIDDLFENEVYDMDLFKLKNKKEMFY